MSTIRAATISDAAGTGPIDFTGQWAAKATINFNAATPATTASNNVTSLTDNGVGNFTIAFNNDFGAADWSASGCSDVTSTRFDQTQTLDNPLAGSGDVRLGWANNVAGDPVYSTFQFFGDLA